MSAAAEQGGSGAPVRRLRVAVLNRVFARSGGGAESYSMAVVRELAARHEMHVFAQQIDPVIPGVQYHRISSPGAKPRWLNQLWYAWASWRATRRGFDVVHSHENTWQGQVQTIHVRPLRFNLLAGRSGWGLALRWLTIALSPRLLSYVGLEAARCAPRPGRQIAVASASLGQELVQVYPHTARMLCVLPPGVDLPGPAPGPRQRWGLPGAGPVLLLVANDYARKGLDALLQALTLLPSDAGLLVVGQGAARPVYEKKVQALGLAGRVVFAGPLADVGPAYRAADLLVHPTLEDSFGMVVLEAMAHGLPVVVSGARYCGAASLLHDGVDALLLDDPQDAPALAEAIMRLLQDHGLAERLGAAAVDLAGRHSWAAVARRYECLYEQVAGAACC